MKKIDKTQGRIFNLQSSLVWICRATLQWKMDELSVEDGMEECVEGGGLEVLRWFEEGVEMKNDWRLRDEE